MWEDAIWYHLEGLCKSESWHPAHKRGETPRFSYFCPPYSFLEILIRVFFSLHQIGWQFCWTCHSKLLIIALLLLCTSTYCIVFFFLLQENKEGMGAQRKGASRVSDDHEELARVSLQAVLLADSFTTKFRPITLERPKVYSWKPEVFIWNHIWYAFLTMCS